MRAKFATQAGPFHARTVTALKPQPFSKWLFGN